MNNNINKDLEFASTVKNVILAEPFTTNGRKCMTNLQTFVTVDEFYSKIYVKPFSEYKKEKTEEKICDPDFISENNCQDIPYYEKVDIAALEKKNSDFINNISMLNDFLFVIKGVAGAGKTTYINNIAYELKNKINFHIFDFEEVRQSIPFLKDSIDLEGKFANNVYKFISVIISEISNVLTFTCEKYLTNRNFLEDIIKCYYLYFKAVEINDDNREYIAKENVDIIEQRGFFDIINEYIHQECTDESFTFKLKTYIEKRLNSSSNEEDILSFVAGILIRLYFCMSKLGFGKHICVIDNVETFVKYDENNPIQVCQLETIIMGLKKAAFKIQEYLFPIQKTGKYDTFFGIIVVMRDTTASTALGEIEQEDDFKQENEIDISNWFYTRDVIESKIKYFSPKEFENCYKEAYNNILNDASVYKWGLNGITSIMYKHSHRRNVECVPDALNVIPSDEIKYFNEMWEIALEDHNANHLKAVCRKYILRLLLDHIQRTKYFDKLMVDYFPEPTNKRTIENTLKLGIDNAIKSESTSYARKIATLLYRIYLINPNTYVSFARLIKTILKPPYMPGNPTEEQINNLGKILFIMNETRQSRTNWTSLVCIKYNSTFPYNETQLCKALRDEWNKFNLHQVEIDDCSSFGVRITDAGVFLAKILPEFEYFACRYLSQEPPLFSKENLKPIRINGNDSFRAVEIIKIIRQRAFKCIDQVIERDAQFFSSYTGEKKNDFKLDYDEPFSCLYKETKYSRQLYHPYRIIAQHQGYIINYYNYVLTYLNEDDFNNMNDKERLLEMVKQESAHYNRKLNYLNNLYPKYFY